MFRRLLFISAHILFGVILGYFLMFSLMHFASLNMQSDDDLNDAIKVGVYIWPVVIIILGWLGNELFKKRKITKKLKIGYFPIFLFTGFVIADFVLGYSFTIFEWYTRINAKYVIAIAAAIWICFGFFTAFIAYKLIKRFES